MYKVIDTSNYSINGKRTLAYLGEALFDCYMRKLTDERVNRLAWWIPIRKWRDEFRNKFTIK